MDTTPIVVEQTFSVPPDVVWQAITNPELMRQWYFEQIEDFHPEVGFETGFDVAVGDRVFRHRWRVTDVAPGTSITYSWRYEGFPGRGLTKWNISEADEGSRLILISTGIETFSQDIPEFTRESGEAGWEYFIRQRLPEFLNLS